MSAATSIEWTHRPGTTGVTWNPTTGCDQISAGCEHCYALSMARRLKAMGSAKYQRDGHPATSGPGFGLTVHWAALAEPARWAAPRTVFVNSMSDLFHAQVPRAFLAQVFLTMARTPRHRYLILTKRPERMARLIGDELDGGVALREQLGHEQDARDMHDAGWPLPNVELGTSIESDRYSRRAEYLRWTDAATRFVSAEPLLGPLPSLDLTYIDQLIIGGESGPGARPMDLGWVRELISNARESGTAVFVKQLGTHWAGSGKGGDPIRWPEDLRIREFPQVAAA